MNLSTSALAATYTCANLTPADIVALCSRFDLPLPTPDVPLDRIVQDRGLTPAELFRALENTTEVRLMIAAAALQTALTKKLPPDPRLDPKPHAKAPVKKPATPAEAERNPVPPPPPVPPARRQLISVSANPKKKGSASWDRFALYEVGLTENQLIGRGLLAADIRWDTQRGFVKWAELAEDQP
jgi:hypothetical protein